MLGAVVSLVLSQWALLAAVAIYLIYRKMTASFSFFVDRGIGFKKPYPFFGNFAGIMFGRESLFDVLVSSYNVFKGKRFYGLFDFNRPLLTIRDPELIRQITVKDFDYFVDHLPFFDDSLQEPLLNKSLIMLTGKKWRDMRATLSPAFTGSKMRQMFQLVVDCADQATKILVKDAKASSTPYVPEMKDLFTRFTNDVIATTAFGIQVNSLQDRNNEFYLMGKGATDFGNLKFIIKMTIMAVMPWLAKMLGVHMFEKKHADFYHSLVHDMIRHRELKGIIRPDMIHLLMEARKGALSAGVESAAATAADDAGFATVEEVKSNALQGEQKLKWDDDDLTAQCFLFFIAGFDTSATLLCFVAQELMENRDVQMRLIEELDEAKDKLSGKPLTYDVLQRLTYLDMVVSETLRKWPPNIALDRICHKAYQMTDENGHVITLEKGDGVWIPTIAIQRDPEYYADPERFDPERFSDERKGDIKPFTYMPFGSGPRNCIGSRFALMECKAFIFYLMTSFTFEVAATSSVPLVLAPTGFQLVAKNGFNIHLKPRI